HRQTAVSQHHAARAGWRSARHGRLRRHTTRHPGARAAPNRATVLSLPRALRASSALHHLGRFLRPVPPFRHPLARASRTPPAPPLPRGAAGVERAHAADRCRIPQSAGGVLRAGELFRLAPRRTGRSPGPDRTLARYGPAVVLVWWRDRG